MGGQQSTEGGKKKSRFKNHCPGCEKNYSVLNIFRPRRKCENDGNYYCKVCTKVLFIHNSDRETE